MVLLVILKSPNLMALINYKNITKPDLMALRILTVVRHFQTFKLDLMALNSEGNLLLFIVWIPFVKT